MKSRGSRNKRAAASAPPAEPTPRSAGLAEWALKGTAGTLVGLLVTLGVQQGTTISERQKVARTLLPEVEHNLATATRQQSASTPGNANDLAKRQADFQRGTYESLLPQLGVLPANIIRQLYDRYNTLTAIDERADIAREVAEQRADVVAAAKAQGVDLEGKELIGFEFGPEAAGEFTHLPEAAKRMMIFQAQLNAADRINAETLKRVTQLTLVLRWQELRDELERQTRPRWWLNWLE